MINTQTSSLKRARAPNASGKSDKKTVLILDSSEV